MSDNVTIEELQEQLLSLKAEKEELETKLTASNETLSETQSSLKQAREINSKLYRSLPSGMDNNGQSKDDPEPEKTTEELVDDMIKEAMDPTLKVLKSTYGDLINADHY